MFARIFQVFWRHFEDGILKQIFVNAEILRASFLRGFVVYSNPHDINKNGMICNSERVVQRGRFINKQKHVWKDSKEESLNKLVQRIRLFFFIIILYFVNLLIALKFCKYIIFFCNVIIGEKLMKNSGEKNFVKPLYF